MTSGASWYLRSHRLCADLMSSSSKTRRRTSSRDSMTWRHSVLSPPLALIASSASCEILSASWMGCRDSSEWFPPMYCNVKLSRNLRVEPLISLRNLVSGSVLNCKSELQIDTDCDMKHTSYVHPLLHSSESSSQRHRSRRHRTCDDAVKLYY